MSRDSSQRLVITPLGYLEKRVALLCASGERTFITSLQSLDQRIVAKELIDDHVDDFAVLTESFDDMAMVNRYFGGLSPTRDAVIACAPSRVVDIGCGLADLPRAIVRVAGKKASSISVTCVDASAEVLRLAAERSTGYQSLRFVESRGESLPFADHEFDVATCTLALHHCEPSEAIALLREMQRVATNVIVADLRRCAGGLIGAYAFSRLLSKNHLTRHDAPLSVRRSYTPTEARKLALEAGWKHVSVRKTAFFRMLLTNAN